MWENEAGPLRDLGAEDIFSVRHVVLNGATRNPEARDTAEQEVMANTKQVASTMTELFSLPNFNYNAVKEY